MLPGMGSLLGINQDWAQAGVDLDRQGWAVLPGMLDAAQCVNLAGLYVESARFRSRVVMARHGFGQGEYQYFAYPLPEPVATLHQALYAAMAPIANRWNATLGIYMQYSATHDAFLTRCHDAGQTRPTPLLLQ